MRIVRVARPEAPAYGVVRDDHVVLIDPHPFTDFTLTDQVAPLDQVRLLAPVIPTNVFAVGRNYADHAAEFGHDVPSEPLIFLKPATSVIGPGASVVVPRISDDVQHEAEVAAVVGRLTRNASVAEALESVVGYTCSNDVTARDLQRTDAQWTRAKGYDTFCPLGPWIDTDVDLSDGLALRCRVNGETRQDGNTADLVFSVAQLVSFVSTFATLLPGDVVLTGTPGGVGPMRAGDTVEVDVEGIGTLTNPVVAESSD